MKDWVRERSGEVSPPWSYLPLDVGPSHLVLSRSAGSADGPVHQEHSKHHLPAAPKGNRLVLSFPRLQQGRHLPGRAPALHPELAGRLRPEAGTQGKERMMLANRSCSSFSILLVIWTKLLRGAGGLLGSGLSVLSSRKPRQRGGSNLCLSITADTALPSPAVFQLGHHPPSQPSSPSDFLQLKNRSKKMKY